MRSQFGQNRSSERRDDFDRLASAEIQSSRPGRLRKEAAQGHEEDYQGCKEDQCGSEQLEKQDHLFHVRIWFGWTQRRDTKQGFETLRAKALPRQLLGCRGHGGKTKGLVKESPMHMSMGKAIGTGSQCCHAVVAATDFGSDLRSGDSFLEQIELMVRRTECRELREQVFSGQPPEFLGL